MCLQVVAFSSLRTTCKSAQPGKAIIRDISGLVSHNSMTPEAGWSFEGSPLDAIWEKGSATNELQPIINEPVIECTPVPLNRCILSVVYHCEVQFWDLCSTSHVRAGHCMPSSKKLQPIIDVPSIECAPIPLNGCILSTVYQL